MEVYPIKDDEIVDKMIKAMSKDHNDRIKMLFIVGIKTGFRISDILRLTFEDFRNKSHLQIKEKKTGKTRSVKINKDLAAAFQEYDTPESTGLLFVSRSNNHAGKALTARHVVNELKDYAAIAGFTQNVGTHTMRKTFGYRVYRATNNLATVQKLLNHTNSGHTLRYIGIEAEQLDDAVMQI